MRNKLTVRNFLCCFMLTGALSFGAPVLVCGSTEATAIKTPVLVCESTELAAVEMPVLVCGSTEDAAIETPVLVCEGTEFAAVETPVLVCEGTEFAAVETSVLVMWKTDIASFGTPVLVGESTADTFFDAPVLTMGSIATESLGIPEIVCGSTEAVVSGTRPELVLSKNEDSRAENGEVYGPPAPEAEDASVSDLLTGEAGKESQGLQVQDGENQPSRQQEGENYDSQKQGGEDYDSQVKDRKDQISGEQDGEEHDSQKQNKEECNSVFQNPTSPGSVAVSDSDHSGETDHSGEGQISRPSYEIASGPETEGFIDDSTDNTYGYYTIMGNTTVTLEEMTSQYEAQGVTYPSEMLKDGGAETIEEFCRIILEEASLEGVRAEVVYEQAMLETGWLQFQGDAQTQQYNFAGLGTTGGGVQGNSYPDVRTGIRAQVQHLKAYACTDNLNESCVDARFDMVRRGSAPYVEWLGIQENPNGGGWAAGADYGSKLRRLLADLKGETYTPVISETVEAGQDDTSSESQTEEQESTAAGNQTAEQESAAVANQTEMQGSVAAGNQIAEMGNTAAGNQTAEQGSAAAGNQTAEQGSATVENQMAGQSEKDTEVQK